MTHAPPRGVQDEVLVHKNLTFTTRKQIKEIKESSKADLNTLQGQLVATQAELEAAQMEVQRMELRVADVAKDEELVIRALENALQSATELRAAPEDVLVEARYGAWIGLYRQVGKILDKKFPLGRSTA